MQACAWLGVDFDASENLAPTLLWLQFTDNSKQTDLNEVRRKLGPLRTKAPPEYFTGSFVPIFLPTDLEFNELVGVVVQRLRVIAEFLDTP